MIGIIIAIIIVLLICLILLSSLTITLSIANNVLFSVRFWGVNLFKLKPKKKTVNKVKKHEQEKTQKRNLKSVLKDYAKGKTRKEIIEEIFTIIKELCVKFSVLLKHVRFKRLEMNLSVATQDAASTAILYGSICSVVYSICGMLNSAYNFDAKKINVSANFTAGEIEFVFYSTIKIRLVYVIKFLLSTAVSIIKLRLGEVKNGRT